MNVPNQFQEVGVFFADDGFISVLEQMPTSSMTNVECYCISGHETSHDFAEWGRACSQEEMEMVRDQSPSVTLRLGFFEDAGEPFQERLAVFVVPEEISSFDAPGHDVLEEAGNIKSGLAGHLFSHSVAGDTEFNLFCQYVDDSFRGMAVPNAWATTFSPLSGQDLFDLFDNSFRVILYQDVCSL